jgi:hypothetical protein
MTPSNNESPLSSDAEGAVFCLRWRAGRAPFVKNLQQFATKVLQTTFAYCGKSGLNQGFFTFAEARDKIPSNVNSREKILAPQCFAGSARKICNKFATTRFSHPIKAALTLSSVLFCRASAR